MTVLGPPFPNGEPVVIIDPALVVDAHNNRVPDWTNAREFTLVGCAVAPGATEEYLVNREDGVVVEHTLYVSPAVGTGIYGWSVYGEPIAAIQSHHRVRFRGEEHEVVGDIRDWRNPYTSRHAGCVVGTRRARG